MIRARYVVGAASIFLTFHLFCHFLNWYFLIWWTDIAAHFLAGATAALFWWWLLERSGLKDSNLNADTGKNFSWTNFISIISFATFVSALWEFWEFSNWRFAWLRETTGQLQIQYQPILGNNLGDIVWGLCGWIIVATIYYCVTRKRD